MTEHELMEVIKDKCRPSALLRDWIGIFAELQSLEHRGCIEIEFRRAFLKVTYIKDLPENPVGTIDLEDERVKRIIELLKKEVLRKDIRKELKISSGVIAECARYLTNKEA